MGEPEWPVVSSPQLILTDAVVITQDEDRTEAEAVSFRHGRVDQVGASRAVERQAGPNTTVLHLNGATVVPGFVDCHTHAARLGELHFREDLSDATSKAEALRRLAKRAARTPEDGWVIGWNWDESSWGSRQPITGPDLDGVSNTHKVLARRVCGHRAAVNAQVIDAIGLDAATPGAMGPSGSIDGTLSEDAVDVAWEACAPSFDTCAKGLAIEARRLLELGITTVADTVDRRDLELLTRCGAAGTFPLRAHAYIREERLDHIEALGLGAVRGERTAITGVKVYTDGSIGARTAALTDPYEDDPTTGMLLRDDKAIAATSQRARSLGLQMKVHAIGDRAIDAALDGFEAASLGADDRPRIEHGELLNERHLERMAAMGVVAVMQPNFIGNWQRTGGLYEAALGAERTAAMNPLRSILEAQVHLAFSSDGMPYGPLYGMACAIEHPTPSERLRADEALAAYTTGAAFALGREHDLGRLAAGYQGDAVVLSEDLRRSRSVSDIDVLATVLGGRLVHGDAARFTGAA